MGIVAVIVLFLSIRCHAVEPMTEPLWPGEVPHSLGSGEGHIPTLTYYRPDGETQTHVAVVICPGGGYSHLAVDHEGHDVAKWLNTFGVTGIVLTYRHGGQGYGHPVPLMDAQRALATVRSKASDLAIDPNRIGILGFSAGGHLASTLSTHYQQQVHTVGDEIDEVSCRPDFSILIYPVITMSDSFGHAGSKQHLIGDHPDDELAQSLSNYLQVTADTPPTFLVHADDDRVVPVENSLVYYKALRKAGVPAECHVFRQGGHGFGLATGRRRGQAEVWPSLCERWMKVMNIIPSD